VSDLSGLAASQNHDGGWPYRTGGSWTEPTVLALLALASSGDVSSPAVRRGLDWLRSAQRSDGGWAPRGSIPESTWVTALVLLLPIALLEGFQTGAAVRWLLSKTGRESGWTFRLRAALISGRVDPRAPEGWAWFPGTASWVVPTALSVLALRKTAKYDPDREIRDRMQRGQEFLMSRRCADGGWNHGSSRALGYDGPSYPETTGLALAALKGLPESRLIEGIQRAEQHLRSSPSLEAVSWLQLGLLSHQRKPPQPALSAQRLLGTQEVALATIAQNALRGSNILED